MCTAEIFIHVHAVQAEVAHTLHNVHFDDVASVRWSLPCIADTSAPAWQIQKSAAQRGVHSLKVCKPARIGQP